MELLTYTDGDLALTEALECDPEVMSELGGPHPKEEIPRIHRMRLDRIANGEWWFKIVPDPSGPPAGAIGIWETTWSESRIHEVGWMVLPAFQGRGIATRALDILVSRARSDPRFRRIHAFPGISNGPSNALCRKFGYSRTEQCEVDYAGRKLRVNHWELDVSG
jgi:RimJ/RimL family protein N-acetyltransferase